MIMHVKYFIQCLVQNKIAINVNIVVIGIIISTIILKGMWPDLIATRLSMQYLF